MSEYYRNIRATINEQVNTFAAWTKSTVVMSSSEVKKENDNCAEVVFTILSSKNLYDLIVFYDTTRDLYNVSIQVRNKLIYIDKDVFFDQLPDLMREMNKNKPFGQDLSKNRV